MNRSLAVALLFVCSLAAVAAARPAAAAAPGATAPTGDVIVIFRAGVAPETRERIIRDAGGVPARHFVRVTASAAHVPDARVAAFLAQHPEVERLIPDRAVHAFAKPGAAASSTVQVVPAGVARIGAAPGGVAYTGAGIGVAVVDTGLDFGHRDLQPLPSACFTAYTAACQDDAGHGTHVGGIIAARNNTVDVVGVAPDATLYAVKVLDHNGSGTDSTVMAGLEWVGTNAATLTPAIRVVNMSLGRPGALDDNPALRQIVQTLHAQGITVVVAAGNDAGSTVAQQVPATYPEVFAVASSTATSGTSGCRGVAGVVADSASYFTTDGAFDTASGIGVTVSAPGEERETIAKSCFLSSVGILSTTLGGGTTRLSGTSMAAPHVAGVAALLAEKAGATLAPEDARGLLRSTADRPTQAPLDSPARSYTFDGEREGILWAPGVLQ